MFSAARRSRRAPRQQQQSPNVSLSALPVVGLLQRCTRALNDAKQGVGTLRDDVAAQCTHAVDRLTQQIAAAGQLPSSQPALLLASVSGATGEPIAVMPSKNRAAKAAVSSSAEAPPADAAAHEDAEPAAAAPAAAPPPSSSDEEEEPERILISEVDVAGVDGELRDVVRSALLTRPNFAYTVREVQDDVQRVFDTGYFSACRPLAEDTRDGVRLTVEVTPNPELRGVVARGGAALPQAEVQAAFSGLRGRTLNYNAFAAAVARLNRWYEDAGVLGQVVDVELGAGDVMQVRLAEAVVNRIALRYVDAKTGEAREEGRTRPEAVLRQLTTRPGQVYSLRRAKTDIEAVYSMGLFEDVGIRPQPAEGSTVEAPRVDLTLEVKERKKTGGLAAGGGISAAGAAEGAMPGFIGTVSYSQRNLFGLGQRLVASAELGQLDSTFRVAHTDPWVRGDAWRTSRTLSAQNTKTSVAPVHGRAADDAEGQVASGAAASDAVFVSRVVSSVEYGRPLGLGWQGSMGLSWQQARCVDEASRPLAQDLYGCPLSVGRAANGKDTMALGTIRVAYNAPSGDAELMASMEQSVPLHRDWLNFNRFTLRADRSVPLGPLRLWACAKGGAIVGDLPSYEAFPIGGTNSVRGYPEGGVGSGRNYAAATAEIHFPLFAPLEGSLFADCGSDLGSGATVPGDPAGCRQKPGAGFGGGAGVRIDTPIGPLRLEYAMNDAKRRRFHLGIGSHG